MAKERGALDVSDASPAPEVHPAPESSNVPNVTTASDVPAASVPNRPEFDVKRHTEIMDNINDVLKRRIKSLRCKKCDLYFDHDNRLPITCHCKISICKQCFSRGNAKCECGETIDTFCGDLEVLSVISGGLSDLDIGINEAASTESMIDILDALGRDLQRQYEGRIYYGKFMEDHTKKLEEISENFSNNVVNFYKSCQILAEINETNAIQSVTNAMTELKDLGRSVDAINVALIKTFRLHLEETNMQIFLNLRTLNFSPALSDALRISRRDIWIVTTELGEENHFFFKLSYMPDEKSYYMHSIRNDMDKCIDPVIIDLKSFEAQNLVSTGIFLTLAMEKRDNLKYKERRFSFNFNNANELLNKQVMLFCNGQRFRCFKNCPCNFLQDETVAITPVAMLAKDLSYDDGLCVDVTDNSDLFDGIPDVGTHLKPSAIGDIFATRSNHNYSQIKLKYNYCSEQFAVKNFDIIATLAKNNFKMFQDLFTKAINNNRMIKVTECGAIYKLRHNK